MAAETADISSTDSGVDSGIAAALDKEHADATGALVAIADPDSPDAGTLPAASVESPVAGLVLQLDVTVPVPAFRICDLVALEKGAVIETHWHHADDVPVWCGGTQLAWTEFEVVDRKLAVRLTRIS